MKLQRLLANLDVYVVRMLWKAYDNEGVGDSILSGERLRQFLVAFANTLELPLRLYAPFHRAFIALCQHEFDCHWQTKTAKHCQSKLNTSSIHTDALVVRKESFTSALVSSPSSSSSSSSSSEACQALTSSLLSVRVTWPLVESVLKRCRRDERRQQAASNGDKDKDKDRQSESNSKKGKKAKIVFNGMLFKRGEINKGWKERYCVVMDDAKLHYYKLPSDRKPIATVNLSSCTARICAERSNECSRAPHCFQIDTGARVYFLACADAFSMIDWLGAIAPLTATLDDENHTIAQIDYHILIATLERVHR
jgi:PH domain